MVPQTCQLIIGVGIQKIILISENIIAAWSRTGEFEGKVCKRAGGLIAHIRESANVHPFTVYRVFFSGLLHQRRNMLPIVISTAHKQKLFSQTHLIKTKVKDGLFGGIPVDNNQRVLLRAVICHIFRQEHTPPGKELPVVMNFSPYTKGLQIFQHLFRPIFCAEAQAQGQLLGHELSVFRRQEFVQISGAVVGSLHGAALIGIPCTGFRVFFRGI